MSCSRRWPDWRVRWPLRQGEHPRGRGPFLRPRRALKDQEVRVALVVAACLLGEAALAKNVLDVKLDPITQLAAMWVWVAYSLLARRDRFVELATMASAVVATAAALVVYSF